MENLYDLLAFRMPKFGQIESRQLKIDQGVSDNLCTKFEHNLTKNNKVTALANF